MTNWTVGLDGGPKVMIVELSILAFAIILILITCFNWHNILNKILNKKKRRLKNNGK